MPGSTGQNGDRGGLKQYSLKGAGQNGLSEEKGQKTRKGRSKRETVQGSGGSGSNRKKMELQGWKGDLREGGFVQHTLVKGGGVQGEEDSAGSKRTRKMKNEIALFPAGKLK